MSIAGWFAKRWVKKHAALIDVGGLLNLGVFAGQMLYQLPPPLDRNKWVLLIQAIIAILWPGVFGIGHRVILDTPQIREEEK